MRFMFRRKKPPIKVFEKGDRKPVTLLSDGLIYKGKEIPVLLCPLCKKRIKEDNKVTLSFNNAPTAVHKDCPE